MSNTSDTLNLTQYGTSEGADMLVAFIKKADDRILLPMRRILLNPGELTGKVVLDLGCGPGINAALFSQNGASRVIGVDVSKAMIGKAREHCKTYSAIEFHEGDVCNMQTLHLEPADVIYAAFLLIYAENEERLLAMVQATYDGLKSGGKCVGVQPNMNQSAGDYAKNHAFGFKRQVIAEKPDGTRKIRFQFYDGHVEDNKFLFEVEEHIYRAETYERLFSKVGFKHFKWIYPQASDYAGDVTFNRVLESPDFVIFSAEK